METESYFHIVLFEQAANRPRIKTSPQQSTMKVESINAFYDSIAGEYNHHMTDSDRQARKKVSELFTQLVPPGKVLDFGGGTGLDLPWLVRNSYSVFFLEPSINMRTVAKKNNAFGNMVKFVEENTDFTYWSNQRLPFHEKIDGIIANFAVFNCIENIDRFFEKVQLVSNDKCHIVATIIDPRPGNIFKKYSTAAAVRALFSAKLIIQNRYKDVFHPTYIHSLKSIRKASDRYFKLESLVSLKPSSFATLIFSKK